ncbi:slipin family protein [Patescibacteria group bacterium]|nr:slipin family protein [Patescibacteria group bacterium]
MDIIIGLFMGALVFIAPGIILLLLISIRQINQYQRGVKFTLGKYSKTAEPGWRLVIPIFQSMRRIDMRTKAVDVPLQESVTKDNISVKINAVIYYKVISAEKSVLEVENFMYAVSQLAQTTMRNIVGEVSLDDLLGERDKISNKIKGIVDAASDPWGIKVLNVELKDVIIPEDMKRTIAKQAEAERERRAVIIKAEGEVQAAENMASAAKTLSSTAGALHLRTLQSLNDLSSDQSNTVIFALPLEILRSFESFNKKTEQEISFGDIKKTIANLVSSEKEKN